MSADAPTNPSFADFGLKPELLKALDHVGYESPSPVQARTIPPLLEGRDVIGQAQTGTGKTGAFALPMLQRLDLSSRKVQGLVLAPTRELALQVAEALQRYAHDLPGFHVLPIYGGQAYPIQLRPLQRGVHVVVGTPGRVIDHLKRGSLRLDGLKMLVLDEADEMLDMGFLEDVEWILEQTPPERQVALFSATMPPAIKRIAKKHLKDPEHVALEVRLTAAETVRQRYWVVRPERKLDALTLLLEVEPFDAMIVFVRTKTAAVEVAERLEARGHAASPLNGDIPQEQRERTVDRLRRGLIDLIVATDVAARGLDVDRISHVVNFDAPHDAESYVHRIGRTGRAGRSGEAVLFVAPREQRLLRAIERALGTRLTPLELPGTEEVNAQRRERLKRKLIQALEADGLEPFEQTVRELCEARELDPLRLAAAAAQLAQGDQPLVLEERAMAAAAGRFDSRPQRGPREPRRPRDGDASFARFRAEVGHAHGLRPGDLVGAITGESPLRGGDIGRIEIFTDFAVIDLPQDLPAELVSSLAELSVRRRRLGLRRLGSDEAKRLPEKGRGRPGGPPKGRKPLRPGAMKGRGDRAWSPKGPPSAGSHGERPGRSGGDEGRPRPKSGDGRWSPSEERSSPPRPAGENERTSPAMPRKAESPGPGPKKHRKADGPGKGKKPHRKGKGPRTAGKKSKKRASKPPWMK